MAAMEEEPSFPVWLHRELLASRTLTELAKKNRKQHTEEIKGNAGEGTNPPPEFLSESLSLTSPNNSSPSSPPLNTQKEDITPHLSLSSPSVTSSNIKSPNSRSTGEIHDEVLEIAHALEELHYDRKRTIMVDGLPLTPKPKKRRRKRHEIVRNFKCTVSGCNKSYGSEGALKTHVKLKHTTAVNIDNKSWMSRSLPPLSGGAGMGPSPGSSFNPSSPLPSRVLPLPSIRSTFAGDAVNLSAPNAETLPASFSSPTPLSPPPNFFNFVINSRFKI